MGVTGFALPERVSLSGWRSTYGKGTVMGRRQGGLSDLLNVAARLPWKVSVALAPVSFVVLHSLLDDIVTAAMS